MPYRIGMRFAGHPAPLTHAAHSPKPPEEPLNGIAIYRARVFLLKEFALVLGTAVDFMLWGFFFKSPEFQVHPGVVSEQLNLPLFSMSESGRVCPEVPGQWLIYNACA